jgi:ABC-type phosphate transport system substrate-binding protein
MHLVLNEKGGSSVFLMIFLVIITLSAVAAFNIWNDYLSGTIISEIEQKDFSSPKIITGSLTTLLNSDVLNQFKKQHPDSILFIQQGGNSKELMSLFDQNKAPLLCITTPVDSPINPSIGICTTPLAYDALCLVTNARHLDQSNASITRSELQAIYMKNASGYPWWYDDSFVRYTIDPSRSSCDIEEHFCHLLLGITEDSLKDSVDYAADVCLPDQTIMTRAISRGVPSIGYLQRQYAENAAVTILSFQGTQDSYPINPLDEPRKTEPNRYDGLLLIQYVSRRNFVEEPITEYLNYIIYQAPSSLCNDYGLYQYS